MTGEGVGDASVIPLPLPSLSDTLSIWLFSDMILIQIYLLVLINVLCMNLRNTVKTKKTIFRTLGNILGTSGIKQIRIRFCKKVHISQKFKAENVKIY